MRWVAGTRPATTLDDGQDANFLKLFVEEEAAALRPSGVDVATTFPFWESALSITFACPLHPRGP